MKTREITNKYGTVVIIDDIEAAKKVLAELKAKMAEKTAVDATIARKAVARRKAAKAVFVPEERISGVKANRAARRAERRASKKTAKRVTNALRLYEEAVTEELHVHDVQVPSVYQKNVPAGLGICSDLQRQFCVQLYDNEQDALFLVPGTKVKFWENFWGELEVQSDNRIWATKIRISELEDTPDFVLLDDGLHKWDDLSHCDHMNLEHITKFNYRNFYLDAVSFTTVDGNETKMLFYSETLHNIAKLQSVLPKEVVFNGEADRMITSTEDIRWLMVNAKSVSIYCSYDCNEVGELAGEDIYQVTLNDEVKLAPCMGVSSEEHFQCRSAMYEEKFANFTQPITVNHGLWAYNKDFSRTEAGMRECCEQFFNMPEGAEFCASEHSQYVGGFGVQIYNPHIKAAFENDVFSYRIGIERYCNERVCFKEAVTTKRMYNFVAREHRNSHRYMELFVRMTDNSRITHFWIAEKFQRKHPDLAGYVEKIATKKGYRTVIVK